MNTFYIVLDTNILVSALLSPEGNSAKIYKLFLSGSLSLIYSTDIFEEYKDVIFRPRLNIPADDAKIVLSAILKFGQKIEPLRGENIMIDEDDRIFYDTTKTAKAFLITGNKRHYPQETFIFTPAEFLEIVS